MYQTSILHRHFSTKSRSRLFWAGLFLGVSVLELSAVAWVSAAPLTDTFYGTGAGANTTTGGADSAFGYNALNQNTTGEGNTAVGLSALFANISGIQNTAVGGDALQTCTTGNNTDIGHVGVAGESGNIRIGTSGTQTATFIAGIRGVAIAGAQPVGVNTSGQLGVRASSARFKEAIKPMGAVSAALLSLNPVTFRYKKQLDPTGASQFGLVAEEVAKVSPDLVTMDDQGKPFTVRYEEVNAMLLNEFIKAHETIERQEKKIEALELALKEQAAQIQKVISQSQLSQSSAPVVVNAR